MKPVNAAFLICGLLFGVLVGYGLFNALHTRPGAEAEGSAAAIPGPAGPAAPTQIADGSAAPAMNQVNELRRRLESNPEDVAAMLELGDLYRKIGRWDEATGFYDRAAAAQPDNRDLRRALAYMYQDSNRCEQAVPHYLRLIETDDSDPDLLTDLGVCYRAMQRYEEALDLFRRASAADPQHWQSVFNTVVVTGLDLGRRGEANDALRRLRELRPGEADVERLAETLASHTVAGEG